MFDSTTLRGHLERLCEEGEQRLNVGLLYTRPNFLLFHFLGWLPPFGGKYFFAASTDRRVILMPLDAAMEPKGEAISIPFGQLERVETGGFLVQKKIAFVLRDGRRLTYRMNLLAPLEGQRELFDQLPNRVQAHPEAAAA